MSDRLSQVVFALLFLTSGAALVAHIVAGVSLLATSCALMAGVGLNSAIRWRRLPEERRAELRRSVRAGALAGLVATGSYDLFRFLLVEIAGFTFWPFDVITKFGRALVGEAGDWRLVVIAGILYHLMNGVGFAIAYTVCFGRRGVWAGILWALGLEVFMVSLYPGWLNPKVFDEFLSVSLSGHIVYGSALGFTARRLLSRKEEAGYV